MYVGIHIGFSSAMVAVLNEAKTLVATSVVSTELSGLFDLADRAKKGGPISSVRTMFAETKVISRLMAKESLADVAKGANVAS